MVRTDPVDLLNEGIVAARSGDHPRTQPLPCQVADPGPQTEVAVLWRAGLADTPEERADHLRAVLVINPQNAKAQAGLAGLPKRPAPRWECPVCDHAEPDARPLCPACGCALTLAVPEAFDVPRAVRRPVVEAAVKRLEAAAGDGQTADAVFVLGMAYLNLGLVDEATRTLREAARMPAADPAWREHLARFTAHRDALARTGLAAAQSDRKKPVVMVVDDSPTVRKLVSATLAAAGYRVTEAESGYAAADRIREGGPPAAIVLDVSLPGIDGFSLCETLRGTAETANVPVVFLTGEGGLFSMLRGYWAGATEYLAKPFHPQQLVEVITGLVPVSAEEG